VHANINDKPGPQVLAESPGRCGPPGSPGQGGRSTGSCSRLSLSFRRITTRRFSYDMVRRLAGLAPEEKRSMCIAESEASLSALPGTRPVTGSRAIAVQARVCPPERRVNGFAAIAFFPSGERRGIWARSSLRAGPEVVTLNPPRSAATLGFLNQLSIGRSADLRPPATRDPGPRSRNSLPCGYSPLKPQPVDMFHKPPTSRPWHSLSSKITAAANPAERPRRAFSD